MTGGPAANSTIYFLDGEELRAKHFCSAGNQPEMKLDRERSSPEELVFVFTGGTNLDPKKDGHIHSGRIHLVGDRLENEWDFYVGPEKKGSKLFFLARAAK